MLTVFLQIRSSFITPEPLKELYSHYYDFYYNLKYLVKLRTVGKQRDFIHYIIYTHSFNFYFLYLCQ